MKKLPHFFIYKFEAQNQAKDQVSKPTHSIHSHEIRLAFDTLQREFRVPGSNNGRIVKGFLDGESPIRWP